MIGREREREKQKKKKKKKKDTVRVTYHIACLSGSGSSTFVRQ